MNSSLDVTILWIVSTALQCWIAFRIFRGDFGSNFRKFALFLAVSSAFSLTLVGFQLFPSKQNRNNYGQAFVAWTYLGSLFEFFVVREICSHALDRYPAIKIASSRILNSFWIILSFIVGGWYIYLINLPAKKFPILQAAFRYQEAASLGFTLFVCLFLAFVAWMPVPLSKKILNHCFLVGALFLTATLSRFATELGALAAQKQVADYIAFLGTLPLLTAWLLRVSPVEDETLNTPKGPLNREEAASMLARLEELNRTLSHSSPKVVR